LGWKQWSLRKGFANGDQIKNNAHTHHTSQYLAILRNSKEAKVSTNQPGVESLSLASEFGQNMNSYRSEIKKSSIVVKSYEQKPSLTWKKTRADLFYMKKQRQESQHFPSSLASGTSSASQKAGANLSIDAAPKCHQEILGTPRADGSPMAIEPS